MKHGWENFHHEILHEGLTKEEACALEVALIEEHRSAERDYGYNLTTGGEGCPGSEKTEAFRQGQSAKVKALWSDPAYREHMSRVHKNHIHSPEQVRKMKENHAGGVPPRRVICLTTGKIYNSICEAARDTGAHSTPISKCCHAVEGFHTAAGLRWAFYTEEVL